MYLVWVVLTTIMTENGDMFYVTMVDSFMSDWGPAKGKSSIFCVCCEVLEQAEEIYNCALRHSQMSKIKIVEEKPCNDDENFVSYKNYADISKKWKSV